MNGLVPDIWRYYINVSNNDKQTTQISTCVSAYHFDNQLVFLHIIFGSFNITSVDFWWGYDIYNAYFNLNMNVT